MDTSTKCFLACALVFNAVACVCSVYANVLILKYLNSIANKRYPAGDKVVFITGCDRGFGYHLVHHFHKLGCIVVAGCLFPGRARQNLPRGTRIIPIDVTSQLSVAEAVQDLDLYLQVLGKNLWAVINNAGVVVYGEFDWLSIDDCQRQVRVNLLGTIRVTAALMPLLQQGGRIIAITGLNGSTAFPGLAVYSGTQYGIESFCKSLRQEVKNRFYVAVIRPGNLGKTTFFFQSQKRRAQEMWQVMTPERKTRYGSYFWKYQARMWDNHDLMGSKSIEASSFLWDASHAVLGVYPDEVYFSSPIRLQLLFSLLPLLPPFISDTIIKLRS